MKERNPKKLCTVIRGRGAMAPFPGQSKAKQARLGQSLTTNLVVV